ncbi:hypothetical protein SELMODRAFT_17165, partial [Selaginella moellendorffii]
HVRLSHFHLEAIKHISKVVESFSFGIHPHHNCETCALGKLHYLLFLHFSHTSTVSLEFVHSDIISLFSVTLNRSRYYILFIE